jgi:hypothetical protein
MKSRRLKDRPRLVGLALLLLLGVVGWRASSAPEGGVSEHGAISIQHEESPSLAMPATRSGVLAGKVNASDQRLRAPSVPLGLLGLGILAVALAVAAGLTAPPNRAKRLWLLGPVTLRGPPRLQLT